MRLLEQFEQSKREVYQVTKNEWVNIMRDHLINTCKRPLNEFDNIDKIETQCFHKEQVREALKKGLEVPEIVLNDYIGLKEEIQAKLNKINSVPIFTEDIYNILNTGDKITVNGCKVTIHSKNNNIVVARIYRKQKQGIQLKVGERYNISMGWIEKEN